MFDRFRKTAPIKFYTTCFVIACHLFFFIHLTLLQKKVTSKIPPQRIVVTTKKPVPVMTRPAIKTTTQTRPKLKPAAVASEAPSKSLPKTPSSVKPEKSRSLKQVKPSPSSQERSDKKLPSSSPKTTQKHTPSPKTRKNSATKDRLPISEELVQQLQESIAKIEKKTDKYRGEETFVLPEKLTPTSTVTSSNSYSENAEDYILGVKEELMQQLHMALHLPDYGEVKVQLQLSENGNVLSVKILKAASQKNRDYLEKELPCLSFSSIALYKLPAKERIFVISFHNEI